MVAARGAAQRSVAAMLRRPDGYRDRPSDGGERTSACLVDPPSRLALRSYDGIEVAWLASEEADGLVSFEPPVEFGDPHEREPRAYLDYAQGGQDVAPEARL